MKDKSSSVQEFLQKARNLLNFHRQCGLDYPLSSELQAFLRPLKKIPRSPSPVPLKAQTSEAKPAETVEMASGLTSTNLDSLRQELGQCQRCSAGQQREQIVFGQGAEGPGISLFIIFDPPSSGNEGLGKPLEHEAERLLEKMLAAINLSFADVYLTNIIKCAPQGKNLPSNSEISACMPFLMRQIELTRPKIICTMGHISSQALLKTKEPLVRLRGRFRNFQGIPLMATFPPSQLLKQPELKQAAWQDLQMMEKKLDQ